MDRLLGQVFILCLFIQIGSALDCIQCDKNVKWYREEEQDRLIEQCQLGQIEPSPCPSRNHTHCIVSWFRSGMDAERTVTERRCGYKEDVTGCTLYNPKASSRKVRHLLNNKEESRKEPQLLFIEVCSETCPFGDCVNSATVYSLIPLVFLPFFV